MLWELEILVGDIIILLLDWILLIWFLVYLDEDGYLCYFCKAGDGVVDVQLIADLHKSEVFTVGKYLEVPEDILVAPPSADLWDGQTDEEVRLLNFIQFG